MLTGGDTERCRLAGPVGSEQGDDAPWRHDEIDAVQDVDAAVGRVNVAELEDGVAIRGARFARSSRGPAEVGLLDTLVVADLLGAPARDDLAELEHVDVVAHLHDEIDVVFDEQDRQAFA